MCEARINENSTAANNSPSSCETSPPEAQEDKAPTQGYEEPERQAPPERSESQTICDPLRVNQNKLNMDLDIPLHTIPIEQNGLPQRELMRRMIIDADIQDDVIPVLCNILEITITENDTRLQGHKYQQAKGDQNSKLTPTAFVKRILKYGCCSPASVVVGLMYLERLKSKGHNFRLTSGNFRSLLLVAILEANKFCDDDGCNNKVWAELGGVTLQQLNALELDFLFSITFDLGVQTEEYKEFLRTVLFCDKGVCVSDAPMAEVVSPYKPRSATPARIRSEGMPSMLTPLRSAGSEQRDKRTTSPSPRAEGTRSTWRKSLCICEGSVQGSRVSAAKWSSSPCLPSQTTFEAPQKQSCASSSEDCLTTWRHNDQAVDKSFLKLHSAFPDELDDEDRRPSEKSSTTQELRHFKVKISKSHEEFQDLSLPETCPEIRPRSYAHAKHNSCTFDDILQGGQDQRPGMWKVIKKISMSFQIKTGLLGKRFSSKKRCSLQSPGSLMILGGGRVERSS